MPFLSNKAGQERNPVLRMGPPPRESPKLPSSKNRLPHKEYPMYRCALLAALIGVLAMSPAPQQQKNPVVVMETSMGTIKIELFQDKAPITVQNFLQYTDDKHYDGTLFHRVIKDFMIQGGGMDQQMKQKPTKAAIKNEASNGLSNTR